MAGKQVSEVEQIGKQLIVTKPKKEQKAILGKLLTAKMPSGKKGSKKR